VLAIADGCAERGTVLKDKVHVNDPHTAGELKEFTTGFFEHTQMILVEFLNLIYVMRSWALNRWTSL
jgi:hypothetical protein